MIATGFMSGSGINPLRELRNGFEAPTVITMADKQRPTADKVNGILFEPDANLAGLLKWNGGYKTRLGVIRRRRVSRDGSNQMPASCQFGSKRLTGCLILLSSPRLARRGVGCDDGE